MKIRRVLPPNGAQPRNPLDPLPTVGSRSDSSAASPLVHINDDLLQTSRAALATAILQRQEHRPVVVGRGITTARPRAGGNGGMSSTQETADASSSVPVEGQFDHRHLPPTGIWSHKNGPPPPPLLSSRYTMGADGEGWGDGDDNVGSGAASIRCGLPAMCALIMAVLLVAIIVPVDLESLPIIADVWYDSVGLQAQHATRGILDGVVQSAVTPQVLSLQRTGTVLRLAELWCRPLYDSVSGVDANLDGPIFLVPEGNDSDDPSPNTTRCSNMTGIVLPLLPWAADESYLSYRQRDIVRLQQGDASPHDAPLSLQQWLDRARNDTDSSKLLNAPLSSFASVVNTSSVDAVGNVSVYTWLMESVHDNDWVVPLLIQTLPTLACTPPMLSTDSVISAEFMFPGGFFLDMWCQKRNDTDENGSTPDLIDWVGITSMMPLPRDSWPSDANATYSRPDVIVRELVVPADNLSALVSWLATRQHRFSTSTTVAHMVSWIVADLQRIASSVTTKYYPCVRVVANSSSGIYPKCPSLVNESVVYQSVTSTPQFAVDPTYDLIASNGGYSMHDPHIGDRSTYWWHRVALVGSTSADLSNISRGSSSPPAVATLSSACKYVSITPTTIGNSTGGGGGGSHNVVMCLELTQPHCVSKRIEETVWGASLFPFQFPEQSFAVVAFIEKQTGVVGLQVWDNGQQVLLPMNVSDLVDGNEDYCYSVLTRHRLGITTDGAGETVATSQHLGMLHSGRNATLESFVLENFADLDVERDSLFASRGWSKDIIPDVISKLTFLSSANISVLSSLTDAATVYPPSSNSACVATVVTFVAPLNLAMVTFIENNGGLSGYQTIQNFIGYSQAGVIVVVTAACYCAVYWLTNPLVHLKASVKRKEADDEAAAFNAAARPQSSSASTESGRSTISAVVPPSSSSGRDGLPSGPLGFVTEFSDITASYMKIRRTCREKVRQLRMISHRREAHDAQQHQPTLLDDQLYLHPRDADDATTHHQPVQNMSSNSHNDTRGTDESFLHPQRRSRPVTFSAGRSVEEEVLMGTTAPGVVGQTALELQSAFEDATRRYERHTSRQQDDALGGSTEGRKVGATRSILQRKVMSLECVSPTSAGDLHNANGGLPAHPLRSAASLSNMEEDAGVGLLSTSPHNCCTLEPFPSDVVVVMGIAFPHSRMTKVLHDIPWTVASQHLASGNSGHSFKSTAAASSSSGAGQQLSHSPHIASAKRRVSNASIGPFEYLGIVLRLVAQHNGVVECTPSHQRLVVSFSGSKQRDPSPNAPATSPGFKHIQVVGSAVTSPTVVDSLAPPPPFSSQNTLATQNALTALASAATSHNPSTLAAAATSPDVDGGPAPTTSDVPLAEEALNCAISLVKSLHDVFFNASHDWVEAQAVHLVPTSLPDDCRMPIVHITLDASPMFLGTVTLPTVATAAPQQPPAAQMGSGSTRPRQFTPSPRNSGGHLSMANYDSDPNTPHHAVPKPHRASNSSANPPPPLQAQRQTTEYYVVGDAVDRADDLRLLQQVRHPHCVILCTEHFRSQLPASAAAVGSIASADEAAAADEYASAIAAAGSTHPPLVPIDVMRSSLQTVGIPRTDTVVVYALVDPLSVAVGERKTLSVDREPRAAADILSRVLSVFTSNTNVGDLLDAVGGGHHTLIDASEKIRLALDVPVLPRALSLHDLLRLLIVAAPLQHAPFDDSSASSPPRAGLKGFREGGGGASHSGSPQHIASQMHHSSLSNVGGGSSSSSASSSLMISQRQMVLNFVLRTFFPSVHTKMASSTSSASAPQSHRVNPDRSPQHGYQGGGGIAPPLLPAFLYDVAENVLSRLIPHSSPLSATTLNPTRHATRQQSSLTNVTIVPVLTGGERFPASPLAHNPGHGGPNRFGSVSFASMHYASGPTTPVAGAIHPFSSAVIAASISMSAAPSAIPPVLTSSSSISAPLGLAPGHFTSSGSISAPPNSTAAGGGSATQILLELRDTPTPLPNAPPAHPAPFQLASTTSTYAVHHPQPNWMYSARVQRTWENLEGLPAEALHMW